MSVKSNNSRLIDQILTEHRSTQPEVVNTFPGGSGGGILPWARVVELQNDYLMCIPQSADPDDETLVPFPVAKLEELRHSQSFLSGLTVSTVDTNTLNVSGTIMGNAVEEEWYTSPLYIVGALIQYSQGISTGLTVDGEPVTNLDANAAGRVFISNVVTGGA